jgi:hypothetical protein
MHLTSIDRTLPAWSVAGLRVGISTTKSPKARITTSRGNTDRFPTAAAVADVAGSAEADGAALSPPGGVGVAVAALLSSKSANDQTATGHSVFFVRIDLTNQKAVGRVELGLQNRAGRNCTSRIGSAHGRGGKPQQRHVSATRSGGSEKGIARGTAWTCVCRHNLQNRSGDVRKRGLNAVIKR